MVPLIILVLLLTYNVTVFGDDALSGSNQFILLVGAAVAGLVGLRNKVSYGQMLHKGGGKLAIGDGPHTDLTFGGGLGREHGC